MTALPWDPIWPRLEKLLNCACSLLTEYGQLPVCFCGIVAGQTIPLDYVLNDSCSADGKDGMLWVRNNGVYPSTQFPLPVQGLAKCGDQMGVNVEMGLVRTAFGVTADAEPPTEDEHLAMAVRQNDEMLIMREAIVCCYPGSDVYLNGWTPIGQDGGAVGGFWQFTISTEDEALDEVPVG